VRRRIYLAELSQQFVAFFSGPQPACLRLELGFGFREAIFK